MISKGKLFEVFLDLPLVEIGEMYQRNILGELTVSVRAELEVGLHKHVDNWIAFLQVLHFCLLVLEGSLQIHLIEHKN